MNFKCKVKLTTRIIGVFTLLYGIGRIAELQEEIVKLKEEAAPVAVDPEGWICPICGLSVHYMDLMIGEPITFKQTCAILRLMNMRQLTVNQRGNITDRLMSECGDKAWASKAIHQLLFHIPDSTNSNNNEGVQS